jgi:hypothetical protein
MPTPGSRNMRGLTLWEVLMPLQPPALRIRSVSIAKPGHFRLNLTPAV